MAQKRNPNTGKPSLRALIVVRLSRLTDESTSPERQRLECERLCAERGWDVVGIAEDLDVSAGKTSPFERPALSRWLNNPQDFDVVVFYRLDRLVRSVKHLWEMITWSEDHSVMLVSATERHFDLSDKFGRLIVALVATVAELELDAIRERTKSAHRHNYDRGRYTGGVSPWGYLPRQVDGEWRLVQDPESVAVIREVVDRVLSTEPMRAIAHDLTERGVLTARDRFAQHQGKPPRKYQWHSTGLRRALESKTLLGYAPTGDDVVRSDDGSPVVRAEPILTRAVFDRVQVELKDRENRKEPTARSSALLLRVCYCMVCGRPAYRLKGANGRTPRYRCASAQHREKCGNRTVPMPTLDDAVTDNILRMIGESERLRRVWDAGEDHSAELSEVNEQLTDLTGLLGNPVYRAGTPQRARLDENIRALWERQERLSSVTSRAAGWSWQPTGEKFSDWWEERTLEERNVWLRSMRVAVGFAYSPDPVDPDLTVRIELGDVAGMMEQLRPVGAADAWQNLQTVLREHGATGFNLSEDSLQVFKD